MIKNTHALYEIVCDVCGETAQYYPDEGEDEGKDGAKAHFRFLRWTIDGNETYCSSECVAFDANRVKCIVVNDDGSATVPND